MTERMKFEKKMITINPTYDFSVDNYGCYKNHAMQNMWIGWQAAIESKIEECNDSHVSWGPLNSKAEVVESCNGCKNNGMNNPKCVGCFDSNLNNFEPKQTAIDRLRNSPAPLTRQSLGECILELDQRMKEMGK